MSTIKRWRSANGRLTRRVADEVVKGLQDGSLAPEDIAPLLWDKLVQPMLHTILTQASERQRLQAENKALKEKYEQSA